MKKSLLIVGLLMAMSLTASAQYKGFSFGFKLGPTFDWTGSKTGAAINQGTKTGFDLGVVAEYYFAENYAIVTGVNVDFVKGHYSFDDMRNISAIDSITDYQLGTIDRQFKTTIYEIPLMLKMVTPELGNLPLRAYAQVGGAFGYTQRVKVMDTFTLGEIMTRITEPPMVSTIPSMPRCVSVLVQNTLCWRRPVFSPVSISLMTS